MGRLRRSGKGGIDLPFPIVDLSYPMFAPSNALANSNSGSNTLITANKPIAIPFFVRNKPMTVFQLGWWNGSGSMTDHVDIGIYDSSWNRLVHLGSTVRTGVSINQWGDIADTVLQPGKYYLAFVGDATTANQQTFLAPSATAKVLAFLGILDSATDAFPLPDPLTNMAAATVWSRVPSLMMALRAAA